MNHEITKCRDCIYWDRIKRGVRGFCRRRAPVPLQVAATGEYDSPAVWPTTAEIEGCGDGKTKARKE